MGVEAHWPHRRVRYKWMNKENSLKDARSRMGNVNVILAALPVEPIPETSD